MNRIIPTRQELLKLKARAKSVKRGHSLMKDKRDALMKLFLEEYKETILLRREFNKLYIQLIKTKDLALSGTSESYFNLLADQTEASLLIEKQANAILGIKIPSFKYTLNGTLQNYSLLETNIAFDLAIVKVEEILKILVKLMEKENKIRLLADEIEKTKRRVNALENMIIPEIERNIKYVKQKLEETAIMETSIQLLLKRNQENN